LIVLLQRARSYWISEACHSPNEKERLNMTLMDVTFPYRVPPGALQMTALGCVREVYGVRKIFFDEAKHTVKVEYDISRLAEDDIAGLLRGAGLDISAPIRLA
jgi:hypothetical protein